MKKILLIILVLCLFYSCGTSKEIPFSNETAKVLKAYADLSNVPIFIYPRSLNVHGNLENKWEREIKNPKEIYVAMRNETYMQNIKTAIDSALQPILDTLYRKRRKIQDSIVESYRIDTGKLFSPDDINFMMEQFRNLEVISWKPYKNINNMKFTKSERARKIAIPIFSKDFDLAIMFTVFPSSKGFEVFKKTNGKWEFYFHSTMVRYD